MHSSFFSFRLAARHISVHLFQYVFFIVPKERLMGMLLDLCDCEAHRLPSWGELLYQITRQQWG